MLFLYHILETCGSQGQDNHCLKRYGVVAEKLSHYKTDWDGQSVGPGHRHQPTRTYAGVTLMDQSTNIKQVINMIFM